MQFRSIANLLVLVLIPVLGACAAPPFDARAVAMEWAAYMQKDYALQPGDTLTVTVHPDAVVQQIRVPPTGKALFARLPHAVQVAGRTMPALAQELEREYRKQYAEPQVQVSLASLAGPTVYLAGEVGGGGAQPYVAGMTLAQAVAAAGGLRHTAKASDVRILRNVPGQPPRTIRVDLDRILHDEAPPFLVLPGDVIYCQTSWAADVGNWIDLYIRRMIPIPVNTIAN